MIVTFEAAEQIQTSAGTVINGNGTVEWDLKKPDACAFGLTSREVLALQDYHKSQMINTSRAYAVKQYMQQGYRCGAIVRALRGRYGERMVKGDHAALSALQKRK